MYHILRCLMFLKIERKRKRQKEREISKKNLHTSEILYIDMCQIHQKLVKSLCIRLLRKWSCSLVYTNAFSTDNRIGVLDHWVDIRSARSFLMDNDDNNNENDDSGRNYATHFSPFFRSI